jgi:hypothetical protein
LAVSELGHSEEGAAPGEERHLPVPASAAQPARGEVVDPSQSSLERLASGPLGGPALAAAGGLFVGLVTFLAGRVLRGPGGRRIFARRRRRAIERQIQSSRSFLVDVHTLRR